MPVEFRRHGTKVFLTGLEFYDELQYFVQQNDDSDLGIEKSNILSYDTYLRYFYSIEKSYNYFKPHINMFFMNLFEIGMVKKR